MSGCQKCGGPIRRIHWNTKEDIGFCDNVNCEYYRRPVESYPLNIPVMEAPPIKATKSINKESPKRKKKQGRAKKGVVEVRGQNGDLIAVGNGSSNLP